MPTVAFVRPELTWKRKEYQMIYDVLAGEPTIKSKGQLYLPAPQPVSTNTGRQRYAAYRTRAVFYNVTKRTQAGLLGQMFNRPPEVKVPDYLNPTVANMDGLGVNLVQQAKGTSNHIIGYGRGGLLSDFPTLDNGQEATRADLLSGRIAPTITHYPAERIINWRYYRDYTTKKLLFVILEEPREVYEKDDYSFYMTKQWRVLRLDESGYYVQEIYWQSNQSPKFTYRPTNYNGDRLDYIPFEFIGADNNDPDIDDCPLYSIAALNISHYRNSADFEDSTFFVGQPTIAITGLSQQWLDTNLKGEIVMGSRNAIPLPSGADMKIIQAEPNNLAAVGMETKERQMVALGAKLVENKSKQTVRTATEAIQDETAEASILSTIADNVSVGYSQALASCGKFVNGNDPKITFKINTAFEILTLDPTARAETIKEWQMGALSFTEMRQVLRRAGIATLDDETAKAEIAEDEQMRAMQAGAADPANVQMPGDTGATGAAA